MPNGPFPTPAPLPPGASNLVPFNGPGRGTGLVVSSGDSNEFSDPDAVDISWYVYNDGPQTTNSRFKVRVLFDEVVVGEWQVDGLATNRYVFVEDYPDLLQGLRINPGPHTVSLQIDPLNSINETNETDNHVESEILWTGPEVGLPQSERLPNLVPATPSGKRDPLFVSSWAGDYYSGKLSVDAPSHVEFEVRNDSVLYVEQDVEVDLYLDGVMVRRVTWSGISAGDTNSFVIADLRETVSISPGPHRLRIAVDPADRIVESDESDNSFEVELVWGIGEPPPADVMPALASPPREPLALPNLTPVRPFGWDAAITARPAGSELHEGEDGWLIAGEDTRIDFAFSNSSRSKVPTSPRLNAVALVDGIEVDQPAFFAGFYNSGMVWTDSVVIDGRSLTPGEHSVRIVFDPDDYFAELSEADNIVERVFTWHESPEEETPADASIPEDELRESLEPLLGDMMLQVKPVRGPGAGERDWTPEIIAAGRAGYFLVTGRDLDDEGFVVHFLPPDEFKASVVSLCMRDWTTLSDAEYERQYDECTQDRQEIGLKTRFNGQVHLFMDLGHSPAQVLGTYFHEIGHGLQDVINPDQTEERISVYSDGLLEAEAQIFEAAAWRAIEEFMGVSLTSYPDIPMTRDRLARLLDLRETGRDEHDIGYVLLWTEALKDTPGSGSAEMLRSEGKLDAAAAKALFDFLVSLRPDEVQAWASELMTSTALIDEFRTIAGQRLTPGLPVELTGHPDLQDPAWTAP